jgi:hypothetical protein
MPENEVRCKEVGLVRPKWRKTRGFFPGEFNSTIFVWNWKRDREFELKTFPPRCFLNGLFIRHRRFLKKHVFRYPFKCSRLPVILLFRHGGRTPVDAYGSVYTLTLVSPDLGNGSHHRSRSYTKDYNYCSPAILSRPQADWWHYNAEYAFLSLCDCEWSTNVHSHWVTEQEVVVQAYSVFDWGKSDVAIALAAPNYRPGFENLWRVGFRLNNSWCSQCTDAIVWFRAIESP